MDEPHDGDRAKCQYCGEAITVRSVRTGREWVGPFWRLAWTHDNPTPGTDGVKCWTPNAAPARGSIIETTDPLYVPAFGRSL